MGTARLASTGSNPEATSRNNAETASDARKASTLASFALKRANLITNMFEPLKKVPFVGQGLSALVGGGTAVAMGHPEIAVKVAGMAAADSAVPGSADSFQDIRTHHGARKCLEIIKTAAGTLAFASQTVAIGAGYLALATSWTGVGGVTFGAIALSAGTTALVATGVQLAAGGLADHLHQDNPKLRQQAVIRSRMPLNPRAPINVVRAQAPSAPSARSSYAELKAGPATRTPSTSTATVANNTPSQLKRNAKSENPYVKGQLPDFCKTAANHRIRCRMVPS